LSFFNTLGPQLLRFYQSLNRLYAESARGAQPAWVASYLDQGKPEGLITYSRMKRFRDHLPAVIRPDIIPTSDGMVITELDSVPGGIGLTAAMSRAYADLSSHTSALAPPRLEIVGGRDGMIKRFAAMLREQRGQREGVIAIVISEEAKDYRPEMTWMAAALSAQGLATYCIEPRQIRFTEEGLLLATESGNLPI